MEVAPDESRARTSEQLRHGTWWGLGRFAFWPRVLTRLSRSSRFELIQPQSKRYITTMAQGTLDEWAQPVVDPEVRAFIYSLVTAVSSPFSVTIGS